MNRRQPWTRYAAVLALALALAASTLTAPLLSVDAARENLYFVAVDEVVLPLDDDAMPFWYASHLYISGGMFSNAVRKTLGVACVQNPDEGFILFFDGSKTLTFREQDGYAEDEDGNTYYPGPVLRNGTYFAPASVLADFFSFSYSVTEVEHGSLVWLRNRDFRLNDRAFAAAAAAQLRNCYQEYLRTHPQETEPEPDSAASSDSAARPAGDSASRPSAGTASRPAESSAQSSPETASTARPGGETSSGRGGGTDTASGGNAAPDDGAALSPEGERPPENGSEPENGSGPENAPVGEKLVFLCLRSGENTEALLDVLSQQEAQATFFCGTAFAREEGGLLRRMTGMGCTIGLLADPGETERTIVEQLEAGNRYLERAGCGKTRLALIENGTPAARGEAEAAGYLCVRPALNQAGIPLRNQTQAAALLRSIGAQDGPVPVWLDSAASPAGLEQFLRAAGELEDQCLPLRETSLP